jgi:hypothetical protein
VYATQDSGAEAQIGQILRANLRDSLPGGGSGSVAAKLAGSPAHAGREDGS